jgi:6,7-dimethyl-8-ribityllumazine synthase
MTLKGPAPQHHDGTGLRVAIVHARWNAAIIEPLVEGTRAKLRECGVREDDIVVQSCPGSWELPIAVQRLYSASQVQASTHGGPPSLSAGDLLGSTADLAAPATLTTTTTTTAPLTGPFDAIVAIGVLIKGETMHFEYIAGSVCDGLMRVQLDTGVPVVLGVLTVLTEEQAEARAGLGASEKRHNHGEDWGLAAVEMAVRRREWAAGKIE